MFSLLLRCSKGTPFSFADVMKLVTSDKLLALAVMDSSIGHCRS